MRNMIITSKLIKVYSSSKIIDGINLRVKKERIGFLGQMQRLMHEKA
jgi:hypothetical protein